MGAETGCRVSSSEKYGRKGGTKRAQADGPWGHGLLPDWAGGVALRGRRSTGPGRGSRGRGSRDPSSEETTTSGGALATHPEVGFPELSLGTPSLEGWCLPGRAGPFPRLLYAHTSFIPP